MVHDLYHPELHSHLDFIGFGPKEEKIESFSHFEKKKHFSINCSFLCCAVSYIFGFMFYLFIALFIYKIIYKISVFCVSCDSGLLSDNKAGVKFLKVMHCFGTFRSVVNTH